VTVELLLDMVEKVLKMTDSSISSATLREQLIKQFQFDLQQLDIMLSLDKRFSRDTNSNWGLAKQPIEKSFIDEITNQAISLREQAITLLVDEKQKLIDKLPVLQDELSSTTTTLIDLGYFDKAHSIHKVKIESSEKLSLPMNTDKYKSVWPLPGGKSLFLQNLLEILGEIIRNPTLDDLIEWVKLKYRVGDWAKNAVIDCVIYPGLAVLKDNRLALSKPGETFFQTKNPNIIGDSFVKNIWGIAEMLSWLDQDTLTLEELIWKFNSIGAGWESGHQVQYRLDWMVAVGYIREDKNSRPKRYRIVKEK
jgi:hypothetical protein